MKTIFVKLALAAAVFAAIFPGSAVFANMSDGARFFELNEKLPPGMTIEAIRELLGLPEEERPLGGNADVIRYQWVHAGLGIEVFGVNDSAYRIDIIFPCGNERNTQRMLEDITTMGRAKYGRMPSYDHATGKHFWETRGIRFAFSRYNSTTVLSSSTKVQ